MRTRLIAIVAVLAAALLGPSAAFADVLTLDQPASPTTSSAVTLQWTDIAGVDAYRVFRADADCTTGLANISDLAGGDVPAGPPSPKTFPDTLPLGGTYCYFLRSVTGAVESADSNHVLVAYDTDNPTGSLSSPVNGAVLTTSSPITVASSDAADATSGVQSVEFFSSPTGLANWTLIGSPVAAPPYSVAWSPADGVYDLKATITDNVGHTTDTALVVGVLADGTPPAAPAAPTGVSPVNQGPSILFAGSTDPGGVNASGIDHYDVLRDGLKVNKTPLTGAGPFSWTDNASQSLDPASGSHGYSYAVVAVDRAGNQSASSTPLAVVMDTWPPDTPVAPTGSSPVSAAPSISFTASSDPLQGGVSTGVDHYDVYRNGSKVNATAIPAAGPLTWTDNASQSSSPVSGSGSYAYTVVAVDAAGNASAPSPARTIALDADAPNTPAAPNGASPVATAPSITVIATIDPTVGGVSTGVNHYDVYRDGSPTKINVSPIPAGGSLVWSDVTGQSTTPASGTQSYSYRVRAVDSVGNVSALSPARVVDLDSTPPSAPALPTGASPVNSAPSISFSATTDPAVNGVSSGINHYDVYRDNVKVNKTALVGAGPFTWTDDAANSLNPASASNSYSYTVLAVDGVGNQAFSPARVILLDVDSPTVAIGGVASNASVSGTLALSATAGDTGGSGVATVQYGYRTNGSTGPFTAIGAAAVSAPYARSFDTTGVADGRYEIRALATDSAGNPTSSLATNVLVDNTAPTTPVAPTGTSPVASAPAITFVPTTDPGGVNASGIDHYDVYRDGSKVNATAIPAAGPYTWSDVTGQSTTPAAGTHSYSYRVVAIDAVGNASSQSPAHVVDLDTTPPNTPAVPSGATPVNSAPSITFTATTDPAVNGVSSGISHYDVYRDNVKVNKTAIPATGPFPFTWTDDAGSSLNPASGSALYSYTVLAVDNVGNQTFSANRVIMLDVDAPTVAIGGVADNAVVNGTLALSATAADSGGSGVATVQYGYATTGSGPPYTPIGAPATTSPFARSFATTGIADGRYDIRALATDAAGNATPSLATNVLVDNTNPTTPAKPLGAVTVVAAPTITVVPSTDPGAFASGIDHYDVYRAGFTGPINSSPIPTAGPYTWSDTAGSSNSPAVTSGTYTYTVVAVDVAGNASAHSPGLSIVLDPQSLSAPTSVSAAATPTSQRPQVSWVAPASTPGFTLDHYRVLRNGVFLQSVSGTSFTDSTPSLADSTYTYQVVATDAADSAFGAASAPVSVVYDTTAPSAPAGVSASAAIDGSVSIGWAASGDGTGSGVARYVVRRSLSSTPPATAADGDATCQVTVTSCGDATTLTGKLYSYAVFAIDRAGNTSLAGNSSTVTARDQLPPAKPTGLGATPGNGTVDLHWAAAGADDDVAGYVLVAKPGSQAPVSDTDGTRVCAAIVAGSTACTATGLTNGATYTFGLFAVDEALNRSQPATVSAAPNGKVVDTKAPAAVSQLKAKVSGRKVTLTWKNPADRDFDHVEITAGDRKPSALKASKRVYSGRGTKATITLAPGQSRWFVVVAYDAVGNASPPASVHVAIAPVSKFGPAPQAKVHGRVRLTWPLRKGARYYNVQVFVGKKRVFVGWPSHGALRLPKGKLKRGKHYTWYVWPGIGAKAKAHYGKLIGRNVFTFTG